jgi:hypothetical protein
MLHDDDDDNNHNNDQDDDNEEPEENLWTAFAHMYACTHTHNNP